MRAPQRPSVRPAPSADPLALLARALRRAATQDEVLDLLAAELPRLLPVADRVSLALLDPADRDFLRFYRLVPRLAGAGGELPRVRVHDTVVGRVVRDGEARAVADVRADREITFGHAAHDGIRSTLSVPVKLGGQIAGVFNTGSRTPGACHSEQLAGLAGVARVVGTALSAPLPADGLVAESPAFGEALARARRAAATDAAVLLTGETGVGKTALARAIHTWSPRAHDPFVAVHLADLQPSLIESELFGHERGAFTGALERRQGRIEQADGGTLFLDEVGEAPLGVQPKLLRVLQDGEFERVGGGQSLNADVRVVAATNRDLHTAAQQGSFRQDLFYRLAVIPIRVPSLRERPEDLPGLVALTLREQSLRTGRALGLSPEGWERVRRHPWPGNIRELESVLLRAAVFESGDALELSDLSPEPRALSARAPNEWPTLDQLERRYVEQVIEHTQGRIEGPRGAAQLLDLKPSTLRSLMKRLGVPTVRSSK